MDVSCGHLLKLAHHELESISIYAYDYYYYYYYRLYC